MKYPTHQAGYSLVEVLVAISILLIATVGPMTIAARSLQYAQFSAQQNTAFFLAQEGIEAIFAIRAEAGLAHLAPGGPASWIWTTGSDLSDCRATTGCGIDWRDTSLMSNVVGCNSGGCQIYYDETNAPARYSHDASGVATPYTRVITISDPSGIPNEVQVTSTVRWDGAGNQPGRSVVLQTYLQDIYDTSP